jgi:1,4-dihydroxy-2-naphthoate octaprenyltransferase
LIGIPLGLLTTNILFINQYPDYKSDKKSDKINLVVLFGKKMSRWIYFLNLILILISTYYFFDSFSKSLNNPNITGFYIILSLLTVYGLYIFRGLFKYFDSRELVNYNIQTIYYQIVFCLAIILLLFL